MIKIFYFSSTGNTLWSARKIAELSGGECELVNIGVEAEKNEIILEAEAVVLLFPSYAYGLPLIVSRFAKRAVFKTPYVAAFATYGTSPGGTLAAMRRILKTKNIGSQFFGSIPAVENYLAIFGPQKTETIEQRMAMQRMATEEAARCVAERRTNRIITFRPASVFVWLLFSMGVKIFYRFYRVSGDCNGCRICEKVCPVSAITMRDGRPVFSGRCEHCQGCVDICPRRAIHFGRANSRTPAYHHPEISLSDLMDRNRSK